MRLFRFMDGMASTVIYLTATLTPASVPQTAAPTVMVVFARPAPHGDTPEIVRAPAVLTAPDPPRLQITSLREVIESEVTRDVRVSQAAAGDLAVPVSADPGLDAAVMAEHEARIAILQERMVELRREGAAAAALLDGLNIRLRRAVAARSLALARQAVERLPSECGAPGCTPMSALADAGKAGPGRRMPHRAALARIGAARPATAAATHAARPTLALRRRGNRDGLVALARHQWNYTGVRAWRPMRHSATSAGPGRHARVEAAVKASARARRLLATARRLLEPGAETHPRLAGLIYWEGSETWSLADYRHST